MSTRIYNNNSNRKVAIINHNGTQYEVTRAVQFGEAVANHVCDSWTEASYIADLFINSPELA